MNGLSGLKWGGLRYGRMDVAGLMRMRVDGVGLRLEIGLVYWVQVLVPGIPGVEDDFPDATSNKQLQNSKIQLLTNL